MMAKDLSDLLKKHDGTTWDQSVNHQHFFCHVLALILGAGLSTIKISTADGPKPRKPELFPTLKTIDEEGEMIEEEIADSESRDKVDPDDISIA
jgi:hypothetical protein